MSKIPRIDNMLKCILGKTKSKRFNNKKDFDGDGILNKFDCQPYNTMRQDKVVLYHGTKSKFLSDIKKQGLKPKPNYFGKPAVFLTPNIQRAKYHSEKNTNISKPVVLKVTVDNPLLKKKEIAKLRTHPTYEYRSYKTILPKNIIEIKR